MKIIILFVLFSCNPTNSELSLGDEDFITDLLDEYIRQDSINIHVTISDELSPYLHYIPEFSDEGYEAPPPPDALEGRYINEFNLVETINSDMNYATGFERTNLKYFSAIKDLDHLKNQIMQSKELVKKINVKKWSKKYNSKIEDKEGWYNFYFPLFNHDSTQVFLQYDYRNGNYSEGNGAVFIKKNGKWELARWIIGWVT